ARQVRLDSFLTFYGPGGFATPDDIEALESVQVGLGAYKEVQWSLLSRGMAKEGEQLNTDEAHLRAFWVQWDKLMRAARKRSGAPRSRISSTTKRSCSMPGASTSG